MRFVTGHGAKDTHAAHLNDGRLNHHPNAGLDYNTITLQEIIDKAANPPQVDKADGQWIIPSSYCGHDGRAHEAQRTKGCFWALAVDIDEGSPAIQQVNDAVDTAMGADVYRVWWSTPSSTESMSKWRLLIPLAEPLPGDWYKGAQAALFDGLEHLQIYPDRTMERTGQVLYLSNRGELYEWGCRGTQYLQHGHPLFKRAQEHVNNLQFIREHASNAQREEGRRSYLAAFRRRYSIAYMLQASGYQQRGVSDHWKSPYASGYSTQDMGDGWRSLSWTDQQQGIGRPASTGNGCFGDQFDLYVHFHCKGDRVAAEGYAKQCLADEDDALFGTATIEHGQSLVYHGACTGCPLGPGAAERQQQERQAEAKAAHELLAQAEKAELDKWGGHWINQVPLNIKPSKLEWLAWHAPGGLGAAVRAKSTQTSRHSLVPALLGALTLFMHIGQGKYVSRLRQHVTPCALMLFQVGSSGSGKGDGTGTFYDLLSLITADHGIPSRRVKTFASGQSLTDYLMHHSANVTMVQNEGGADRKAGKGSTNFESLMAGVTDAYTSFVHGIEVTHTKSDEKEATAIAHPTVGALQSSTPNKLFASIDNADGESGWLGRFLFVPLVNTYTNKNAVDQVTWPEGLVTQLNNICSSMPPLPGTLHPDVWCGHNQCFHVIHFTDEAKLLYDQFLDECDEVGMDERRGEVEKAVYGRGAEAASRLATVAALAKDKRVDAECFQWASMLVRHSLDYVTSKMANVVEDAEGDTPSGRIRKSVKAYFTRVLIDTKFRASMGTSYRKGPDGDAQIGFNMLKRKIRDNTGAPSRLVDEELKAMIEDGEMIDVSGVIDLRRAHDPRIRWLKYHG